MKRMRVAAATLAAVACGAAAAETIYRCGNEYTDARRRRRPHPPGSAAKRATSRGAKRRSPPR